MMVVSQSGNDSSSSSGRSSSTSSSGRSSSTVVWHYARNLLCTQTGARACISKATRRLLLGSPATATAEIRVDSSAFLLSCLPPS